MRPEFTNDRAGAVAFEGNVEKILYVNPENDFVVAVVRRSDEDAVEVVVGAIPEPAVGETLRITGQKSLHDKHGWRVRIEGYERIMPATAKGILTYLGSGLVKGIGPSLAKNLVDAFGERTLEVIEEQPAELLKVEGIGLKRSRDIVEAWARQRDIHNVMMFLQQHEISSTQAHKIYRHYGGRAIDIVRRNPYVLARDIRGIAFKKADRIAGSLGIAKDSPERLAAGVAYVLDELAQDGHSCVPTNVLADRAADVLDVSADVVRDVIEEAAGGGTLAVVDLPAQPVYSIPLLDAETRLTDRLGGLLRAPREGRKIDVTRALRWVESRLGMMLSDGQKRAVAGAISEKVCVMTGGPGVGKTTIIRAVVEILEKKGYRIALAGPTGRAAKRLAELTGRLAETIHRLLRYNPVNGRFEAGSDHLLPVDVVIVDEASMLDVTLAKDLLCAIPDHASLILVGDVDQLPSVGPGKVLEDIIKSGLFAVFRLTEVFRQSLESDIVRAAHMINAGRQPDLDPSNAEDFFFIEQQDPVRAVGTIKELVSRRIPKRFGFDALRDIQVLSPMHRGPCGIDNLNKELQSCLNAGGEPVARHGTPFRQGDRVMQTINNYDKDVFNGDIGKIVGVNRIAQTVQVDMGRGAIEYELADLDELALSYAVSIHKSQGSEYPAIVIPLFTQHFMMLSRKLLYTAVTRGEKLVVIVGTRKALGLAIRNEAQVQRYTLLAERLSLGNEGMKSSSDSMWLFKEEDMAERTNGRKGKVTR